MSRRYTQNDDWFLGREIGKDLRENNLDISHPIFGSSFERASIETSSHSCAMPRVFLNRSVQIRPQSWRDMAQVIFSQVLS